MAELAIPPGAEGVVEALVERTGWSRERAIGLVRELPQWVFGGDAGDAGVLLGDLADAADRDDALLAALPDDLRLRLEDWRGEGGARG